MSYENAQTPAPAYNAPAPAQQGTNTLAIVGFVLSFFVNLAGVICGHIALSQIKKTGEKGRGFAIAALIIGYLSIAASIILTIAVVAGGLAAYNSGELTGY